jgi:peptide/nickel transport system permease protein
MVRHRVAIAFLILWSLAAIFAPLLASSAPNATDLAARLQGPSMTHPLGTDELGRDVFSRLLFGGRISLAVVAASLFLALTFGTAVGILAGYLGGLADQAAGRLFDVLLAMPGILLAIAIVAFVGRGFAPLILALSATAWVGYARMARSLALSIREREFVASSRAQGGRLHHILLRHVLPHTVAALSFQAAAGAAGVLLAEGGLSFLGLGVQPPNPSWGGMLATGCDYLLEAPHLALASGTVLFFAVWALNALGEILPEGADPRRRRRVADL